MDIQLTTLEFCFIVAGVMIALLLIDFKIYLQSGEGTPCDGNSKTHPEDRNVDVVLSGDSVDVDKQGSYNVTCTVGDGLARLNVNAGSDAEISINGGPFKAISQMTPEESKLLQDAGVNGIVLPVLATNNLKTQ